MKFLDIEQAACALKAGDVVVMPTDTVYGLGVAVCAAQDPQALFRLKGRPDTKPVAWLVESASALDRYGAAVRPWARRLAERFWPGALTLVVRASDEVPLAFQSATGTIGLRMPASSETLALIRAAGSPLAVTSANVSGEPAAISLEELDAALVDRTAGVLHAVQSGEGSSCAGDSSSDARLAAGVASTVVDCTGAEPIILRAGALSLSDLKGCC